MAAASPPPEHPSRRGRAIVAIVLVAVLVLAGVGTAYVLRIGPFAPVASAGFQSGTYAGLTDGEVVTLSATGPYECTPTLATFYPSESASTVGSDCEVGGADQGAVEQVPQWLLVPAFSGWSAFGQGSSSGSPETWNGAASLPTDCGAGGTTSACPDYPANFYVGALASRSFAFPSRGAGPDGVFPMPAHDVLLNTSATFPSVEWGTVVVLVFDPYIFPSPFTGTCAGQAGQNVSNSANCLASTANLSRALATDSPEVAAANSGPNAVDGGSDGLWALFGDPSTEAIVVGATASAPVTALDSNLYLPYSVAPGGPSVG